MFEEFYYCVISAESMIFALPLMLLFHSGILPYLIWRFILIYKSVYYQSKLIWKPNPRAGASFTTRDDSIQHWDYGMEKRIYAHKCNNLSPL